MCQWKSLIQRRPRNVNVYLLIIRVFFLYKMLVSKFLISRTQSWFNTQSTFCCENIIISNKKHFLYRSDVSWFIYFWKQFASNSALADIKCYSYYGTKWNVNTPGNSLKFVHFVVVYGLQHFLIVLSSNRKKDRLIKTFNKGP